MSLTEEVMRNLLETTVRIANEHATAIAGSVAKLQDNIGKPWKFRVAAIAEAKALVAEPETPPEPPQ